MSSMTSPVSIIIADDHPIVRQGFVRVIEQDPHFRIAAQCGNGEEALAAIEQFEPTVAVLDISMPDLSGFDVVRRAQRQHFSGEFVLLTMYNDEEYLDEAMNLGVKGFILKDCAIQELLSGLRAVSQGQYYISPAMSGYLVQRNSRKRHLSEQTPGLDDLTPTERNVLRLIAENKTSKEIAQDLIISYRTVQNHRSNICRKLGFKGHNRLLQFALEHRNSL